jgi:hypothetical protein
VRERLTKQIDSDSCHLKNKEGKRKASKGKVASGKRNKREENARKCERILRMKDGIEIAKEKNRTTNQKLKMSERKEETKSKKRKG